MRALLPVLLLTLWAAPGRAQTAFPKECDPQDPLKCSQGLLAGQPAPFSGQLLTTKLAIDLGQKAAGCDGRLALELEREKGLAEVRLKLETQLLIIERDTAKAQVETLQKALQKTEGLVPPPPWYERPPFVAVVSVVVTTGVLVLAVKTVQWTTAGK